ncbi:MAG: hypothetical protein ACFFG0_35140 [Candidatus Thorarchaeota archaeon]
MKRITIILILITLLFNCSNSIKVYIDEELSKEGIDIWEQNVKYVELCSIGDVFFQPDVCIYKKDRPKLTSNNILGACYCKGDDRNKKPINIHIYVNNNVVIAHEFGHYLGYDESTTAGSIMCGSVLYTNMPLEWFNEFSNR